MVIGTVLTETDRSGSCKRSPARGPVVGRIADSLRAAHSHCQTASICTVTREKLNCVATQLRSDFSTFGGGNQAPEPRAHSPCSCLT